MNRLKELREEAMMTVRELSERSGVSEDTITKIENGHRKGRSMTLRKLAKALGIEPYQLSPEQFGQGAESEILPQDELFGSETPNANLPENAIEDAHTLRAAISRAFTVVGTVEAQSGLGAQRHLEHLTEGQRDALLAVAWGSGVTSSTIAQQVGRDVSAVNRDLAILGELGLVSRDESGKSRATPLGEGVGRILTRGGLHYDEALRQVSTLMKAYEPVAEDKQHAPNEVEAFLVFELQALVVRTIERIVTAAEPSPAAQKVREDLWANAVEIEAPVDPWDLAGKVWKALNHYMTTPPSQQTIRADIGDLPPTDVIDALSTSLAAYRAEGHGPRDEGSERIYENFLWLLKKPLHHRYPIQRGGRNSLQQAQMRRIDS